jgi:hypothetical protein
LPNSHSWQDIVFAKKAATPTPPPPRPNLDSLGVGGGSGTDAYVAKAIAEETDTLAAMAPNSGRNHQLNRAAFNLRRFIDNGTATEQHIHDALMHAAHACGLLTEDGHAACEASIQSGFRGSQAKVGARPIPALDGGGDVTEVTAETLGGTTPTPTPGPAAIYAAEQNFWTARPTLTHIYDSALARMCAPWAVLAHCAARALYAVPPTATLPPLVGGRGSLNWFGIIVAPSGGGKSAAEDVARELIDHPVEQRALGSGEGLMESYLRPADRETGEPPGQHEAIMFLADESDTIAALSARSGSTLLSTLRTAWTGRTLSFGYRGRTNEKIEAHTYRATLVMAMQPSRAGWILADSGGGTPQRFNWFPGIDQRITLDAWTDAPIYPLTLPTWREWQYDRTLTIPGAARDTILRAREQAARGEQGALDGHALFCREKFAYALTILDGRSEMSEQDWELSGIAAQVSTRTREWVSAQVESDSYAEAEERGRIMGVSAAASDEEKAHRAAVRTRRVSGLILAKLAGGPLSEGDLRRAITSRDRPWVGGALQALSAAGLIVLDGEKRWSVPGE